MTIAKAPHYNKHYAFTMECIDVTQWMSFMTGNPVKYLWRAWDKGQTLDDLTKAVDYLRRPTKISDQIPPAIVYDVTTEAAIYLENGPQDDAQWYAVRAISCIVRGDRDKALQAAHDALQAARDAD